MSILQRIKNIKQEFLVMVLLITVGFGGFGLGRLSGLEAGNKPITIKEASLITDNCPAFAEQANFHSSVKTELGETPDPEVAGAEAKLLVGSKNSNKVHFPWCSGAQRIKEENKVWFRSLEEAMEAGYSPAGNCPGIE